MLGAFRHLGRALDFIEIASAEYERDVRLWLDHTRVEFEAMKALPPGAHPVTDAELERMKIGAELAAKLHLRIETFYVFAQVALDALVALVDTLRGPAAVTLGRHRTVAANLDLAAEAGELPVMSEELRELIAEVTARIKDYRDDFVVHVREARQLKATGFALDSDEAFIAVGIVVPREGEELNVRSESPPELLALLHRYLGAWVAYLRVVTAE